MRARSLLTWSPSWAASRTRASAWPTAQIVLHRHSPEVEAVQFFIPTRRRRRRRQSRIPDQNGESKELVTTADYSNSRARLIHRRSARSRRRTLPVLVRGRASTTKTCLGHL